MSFDAIQWALAQDVGKSSTKFVLVAMASFVNAESREWVCWPSYAALARLTQQDSKTVEAAVYRLKQIGLIVDTGQRKGDTGKVIAYRLNDPKSGGVTPGLQSDDASSTRLHNDPKTGGVEASGNPPKFPSNPPKFPNQSPQISGVTTPKTGVGTSKEEKKRGKALSTVAAPSIPGVADSLVADWLVVRKAKRAGPLTATAVAALVREANKVGITVEEAVRFCCEQSWQGFNSGWYQDRMGIKGSGQESNQETFV